jgi:hypothetical protein
MHTLATCYHFEVVGSVKRHLTLATETTEPKLLHFLCASVSLWFNSSGANPETMRVRI